MAIQKLKSFKGRCVRITRLDECGAPVVGSCSSVVTECFTKVTVGNEYEKGDEYTQKNAWGELDMKEKDPDRTKWVNVKIDLTEVDPSILDIVHMANPVTHGGDTIGATFGPEGNTQAFAIEVWTKRSAACGAAARWGYIVVPFVKNGKIDGDLTVENAPMTLSIMGEGWEAPADWGIGPYGDNPFLNVAGFPEGDFWGAIVTTVAPPAATAGCVALAALPSKAAVEPGDVFATEATITASDSTRAALLAGLGYVVAAPGTAWASGEFFSVGAYAFNWSGSAWAAGAHA